MFRRFSFPSKTKLTLSSSSSTSDNSSTQYQPVQKHELSIGTTVVQETLAGAPDGEGIAESTKFAVSRHHRFTHTYTYTHTYMYTRRAMCKYVRTINRFAPRESTEGRTAARRGVTPLSSQCDLLSPLPLPPLHSHCPRFSFHQQTAHVRTQRGRLVLRFPAAADDDEATR